MFGLIGGLLKGAISLGAAFWGPIAGAAVGVVGGLAVQKKQQQAAAAAEKRNQEYVEESKTEDLTKLRESAKKAGFNPLTALRAGAGNFAAPTAIMPSMSGYHFAVEAMSNGVNQAIQYASTYKERAFDAKYKTYQMEALQTDIALNKARLSVMVSSAKAQGAAGSLTGKGTNPATDERTAVTTPLGTITPANVSDAEAAETRYGDVAQELFGVSNLISDLYASGILAGQNLYKKSGTTFGFNNRKRGSDLMNSGITTSKLPSLSAQNFGPNYRDRMGVGASYYNF